MRPLYAIRYTLYAIPLLSFFLAGCIVRTYPVTRDRVDQDLSGNRGFIQGEAPVGETGERKATRTTRIVEIELRSPIKFEKAPKEKTGQARMTAVDSGDEEVWGNRGYLTQSQAPRIMESEEAVTSRQVEQYTVQKNDTLQKISQKFYGTSKKWNKIFEANADALKSPNKIYPGQVINVPVEPLKEPRENLK